MKPNNLDFKVQNNGTEIVLSFINEEGKEVHNFNFSWISAFRLAKDISMAVDFGFENLKQKLIKTK